MTTDEPTLRFESAAEWRSWLEEHHGDTRGVWLALIKVGAGVSGVTYAQAVDVALCFGWIDSQMRPYDESYRLQRFTPRRPRSNWSAINVGKATALIASGQMAPAGLAEIERAKADGRWGASTPPGGADLA